MSEKVDMRALLEVAKCPCCDGSGGRYDNYGNAEQCQWCCERSVAIAAPAVPVVQAEQQPVAFANFKEMELCMHKPAAGAWEPVYAAPPAHPDAALVEALESMTPEPEEIWSLTGENGSWDYESLGELIRDNYGHDCDSAGPMSERGALTVGSVVKRGVMCKDDPASFLQDASEVLEWMSERAYDSDGGEWADNYPEVSDEAMQALEGALEPLKAWARAYCQPRFFTVKAVTYHEVSEADVQAAMAGKGSPK